MRVSYNHGLGTAGQTVFGIGHRRFAGQDIHKMAHLNIAQDTFLSNLPASVMRFPAEYSAGVPASDSRPPAAQSTDGDIRPY
jgi:hypothetical protein